MTFSANSKSATATKAGGDAALPANRQSEIRNPKSPCAFTLIELLVVIAIIGALAAIGLPAIRGMTKSNAIIASNRQFLDDLSYARQRALADHTTVFVIFVPTNVTAVPLPPNNPALDRQITNLYTSPFTTYALLEMRQLGEQPGQAHPHYLTGWRSLPAGVFIAQAKFIPTSGSGVTPFHLYYGFGGGLPFPVASNYPSAQNSGIAFPYLAFNYLGQLTYLQIMNGQLLFVSDVDQYIPLARGSIFFDPVTLAPDVQESPVGNSAVNIANSASNVIYVNALTGRAKILQQSIQ